MTDIAMILTRIGATLRDQVGPALEGRYLAGTAGMTGMLAMMAGEAVDGAADRLKTDIDAMAALLRADARDPGDTEPPSLKLSDMRPIHDRLAAALIELQAELELRDDADARALNARIWAFHLSGAAARLPNLPAPAAK